MPRINVLFVIIMVCWAFSPAKGVAMPVVQLFRDDPINIERVHYICSIFGQCYWLPHHYRPPYLGPGVYTGYYRYERGPWW